MKRIEVKASHPTSCEQDLTTLGSYPVPRRSRGRHGQMQGMGIGFCSCPSTSLRCFQLLGLRLCMHISMPD
jgi:hypothetical protein